MKERIFVLSRKTDTGVGATRGDSVVMLVHCHSLNQSTLRFGAGGGRGCSCVPHIHTHLLTGQQGRAADVRCRAGKDKAEGTSGGLDPKLEVISSSPLCCTLQTPHRQRDEQRKLWRLYASAFCKHRLTSFLTCCCLHR